MARRILIGAGAVVGLVVAGVVALNLLGSPLDETFDIEPEPVVVPDDPAALERGAYLAEAVAVCVVCHGDDLAGRQMFDSPVFGYIHTPNLTPGEGGVGGYYDNADWSRALRHGVAPDGTGIIFMPTDYYWHLTDDDLGALVGYLESLPPVDNRAAEVRLGPLSTAMINAGAFGEVVRAAEIDHEARPPRPDSDGEYLAAVGGCTFCHGPDLGGGQGPEPGAPPAPDLTPEGPLGDWDVAEFATVLRTGTTPDGGQIDPRFMPWEGYRNLTDADIEAIWAYLSSLG